MKDLVLLREKKILGLEISDIFSLAEVKTSVSTYIVNLPLVYPFQYTFLG